MRYAQMTARDLPIGSMRRRATLVTQRMKRSGMRWRSHLGSLIQSQCRLGACLADLYQDGRTARQHCRLSCTATSQATYTQTNWQTSRRPETSTMNPLGKFAANDMNRSQGTGFGVGQPKRFLNERKQQIEGCKRPAQTPVRTSNYE